MKTKIPAFTLFELVLGMLLSAIVIGMVYQAWTVCTTLFGRYAESARAQSELLTFSEMIHGDVDRATSIKYQQGEVLMLDSAHQPMVTYLGSEGMLIRKALVADTFKFAELVLSVRFEGKEVSDGLADQLECRLQYRNQPLVIGIRKEYSSEQLIQSGK